MTLLSAQVQPVGTVDGTVKDPSGALLTGIQVTLRNVETGVSREAATNDSGYFFFPLVNPGKYEVAAAKAGFKKGTQQIAVRTGIRSTADFGLELGAVNESVEVSAQAALLETSTAGVSRNVQQKVIQDLPLLGRNPLMLINLAPGITNNVSTGASTGLIDVDNVSYSSVNGSNRRQNEFMLDGIPNNISDRVAYIPGVDDVEEFTVQTNALDAEYGHGGGMYVNITTKSGTNEYHGSLYEYLRNDKLNANSFFSNKTGTARSEMHFNQYGVTAGGPVIKNKVFWFFNWESLRRRTPTTYTYTAPTDLQRQGDFSKTYNSSGTLFQIADPLTTTSSGARTLFADNKIPTSRINTVASNVMAKIPSPTVAGDALTGANNFYKTVPSAYDGDNYSARVDPNINRHRLFARWSHNQGYPGDPTPYDIGGGVGFLEGNNRAQTSVGLSDVYTVSPSMVVTAQVGYTRWTQEGIHPTYDMTALGFSKTLLAQMQQTIFPRFTNADMMSIGASEGQWFEHTNTLSYNVGATKIAGSHNMKWGLQAQVKQNNSVAASYPCGTYAFDRGFTQPNAFTSGNYLGNGIASFLLGDISSGSADLRAYNSAQAPYYGFYFQDDFKVTQKLTLNLGLRYELLLGTTERYDRNVLGFDSSVASPIETAAKTAYAANPISELAASSFAVKGGLFFATSNQRRNVEADKSSWAPRFGVAYRLFPRTVIRTGLGIFYSQWWQPFVKQTGYSSNTAVVTTNDSGLTPANTLSDPLPSGLVQPTGASDGYSTLLGQSLSGIYDYWRKNQRNYRWNFGFQHEIAKDFSIEVNYIGQRGTRLPLSTGGVGTDNERALNSLDQKYYALGGTRLSTKITNPFYGLIPSSSSLGGSTITIAQLLAPYPQFSSLSLQRNTHGDSFYHSLQINGNKRFGHGLTIQMAYTWSKLIEKLRFIEVSDPGPSKAIGEFDNPHRVSSAIIYELPFGKGKWIGGGNPILDKFIGGWQWNAMYIYQTGQAASLSSAIATGTSPKLDNPTIAKWFNTDCMKTISSYTARRLPWEWTGLRVPAINNWDMSFTKMTTLYGERVKLQFRCEMINAFNRVWFGGLSTSPSSSTYGQLTSQANSPRNIQMGMKLVF